MTTIRKEFRRKVEERRALVIPGAFNAMSARIIADQGFEAVFLTGAGLTNMYYGMPDLGFMGLRDVAEHTARIRDVVDIPLFVDIDTGFGNAVNVRHTIKTVERAGADAVQLEDQTFPKRCGHFAGKSVAPVEEMIAKIKAAADARVDPDFLIVARTDARAIHGFDHAVERVERFAEAGADVLFVEAAEGLDEVRRLPGAVSRPLLLNLVIGGKTPALDLAELERLRYGIVLYANAALQGAVAGMQRALGTLRRVGRLDEDPALVTPFAERQRLVDKPFFDDLEKQYAS